MTYPQAPGELIPPSMNEHSEENEAESSSSTTTTTILPSRDEVLACQFSSWYPLFSSLDNKKKYRGRSNVTIKAVILDLPDRFVDYLNSDQLILPAGARTSCSLLEHHHGRTDPECWSSDDDDDDDDDTNEHAGEQQQQPQQQPLFSFPELDQAIADAMLVELQCEAVTPKLNWSAPRDAVWVNAGTLECRTAGDVYLLLKASDFCAHDLHHALRDVVAVADVEQEEPPQQPVKLQLALRKWCNLYPSQEFRCFVSDQTTLLAISQRHHSQHWPHLVLESTQRVIRDLLQHFFDGVVQETVATALAPALQRYVFDVYVDQKRRVWLIDINVWASRTDALLFDWAELTQLADNNNNNNNHSNDLLPVMRVVETSKQVRADPLASYKAPIDTLHVASAWNGGDSNNKFREFMNMCKRPGSPSSSSSSSDGENDSDEGECA